MDKRPAATRRQFAERPIDESEYSHDDKGSRPMRPLRLFGCGRRPAFLPERYRGLRGIIRHLSRVPGPHENARRAVGNLGESCLGGRNKPPWGTCKWCGLSVSRSEKGRPRMWHPECHSYRAAAQGSPLHEDGVRGEMVEIPSPYGGTNHRQLCPACGKADFVSMEQDHILAIGVARRLGLYFYRRAFLPDNLWWICEPCHRAKTNFDRALMKALDGAERTTRQ